MKNRFVVGIAGAALSVAILGWGYVSGQAVLPGSAGSIFTTPAQAEEAVDRAAVEKIVREYLLANPEIIVEMQVALEAKQRAEQRVAQQAAIESDGDDIFNASYDGVVGNPDGKVTIVEFYDYNCGYCKRAMSDMEALVKQDPELRFVLKEFPILGPDSQKAHVVSMAFRTLMPEKYGEFHRQLLGGEGRASEETAMAIALDLGADEAALRKEMENPAIQEAFANTYELADKLAITGTPSYVLGDEVVFGALGEAVLAEKVANLKSCDSTSC